MKLLVISTEFPPYPGGIGTNAYHLSLQLQQIGWEISVVTQQDYAEESEILHFIEQQPFVIQRLRPVRFAPREAFYRWRTTSRYIRKFKPDLLLATGQRAVWLTACLAKKHRLPWLAIGHGTEFGRKGFFERKLTKWAFQRADGVVCVSNFTWNQMQRAGINPRTGRVIPNGADDSQYTLIPSEQVKAFRETLGFGGAHLLVSVGNVTERKGQDIVIRALPLILAREPNVHYLIIGKPSKQKEFMNLAQQLNVANYTHFYGRVDGNTLVQYLNACDLFVMTSRHTQKGDFEGYGIAVLEAALCGKPAVVSGNSGLSEAVVDDLTGMIVSENDHSQTAEAILHLLSDDEKRNEMGKAARRRTIREGTWKHRAIEYDRFLRTCIHQPDAIEIGTVMSDVHNS